MTRRIPENSKNICIKKSKKVYEGIVQENYGGAVTAVEGVLEKTFRKKV